MSGGENSFPDLREQWRFERDHAVAVVYPYEPATVSAGSTIAATDIIAVYPDSAPPRFRVGGELLFVPAPQRSDLEDFAMVHDLPVVRRAVDAWDFILEPFLDTEYDEEWTEKSLLRLEQLGIGRDETAGLRARFGGMLMLFNFAIPRWEWVSLGHTDLLDAAHPDVRYGQDPFVERLRKHYGVREPLTTADEYREVYWLSMEVALRQFHV